MIKLFLVISLLSYSTFASTTDTTNKIESYYIPANRCDIMMKKYGIDPSIKSIRGWRRTIYNNKLELYIKNLSVYDKSLVEQCLIQEGFDIDKLKRGIGVKK